MKPTQLSLKQIFFLAAAECRGVWRRFLFFVLCIAIGVGAVMTIQSFSKLLNHSIKKESKGLLAADIAIKGSWEQSAQDIATQQKVLPPGTDFVFIKELQSMARYPSEKGAILSLLVELKSVPRVSPHYPLYGTFKSQPDQPLSELLQGHGAVVDPAFLLKTGLKIGQSFTLGKTTATINGTVDSEPDRISRAFSIGPRVLISRQTLDDAELIQPGSRVKHRTLIRLPGTIELEKAVALLRHGLKDHSLNLRTYQDVQSSLTDAMARMGEYLGAVGVIALIMGGIGVAMIIGTFMAGKLDTIAILNCLGARPRTLFKVYLLQALLLGFVGSVLGVALGYGLQFLLPGKLEGLLNIQVEPRFLFGPALQSLSLGMATTFMFCLWPLVRAVKTKPLRLFRRNFEEEEISKGTRLQRWGMGLSILTGLALMVFWLAGSVTRGAVFLSALVISALVLRTMSWLILKLLRKLPPSKNMTHRYGLANLYRPNSQAVSIITCLGMGIMLVLTIRLVQMDMVRMLQSNTEAQPPNYFFIDIQSDQTQRFNTLVEQVAPQAEKTLTPLIRSRLHSAGERLAVNWVYKNPREEEWFLKRDFVLTYMAGPPPKDNVVIKGKWWSEAEADTPQVSLEEDAAKRLGIDIGDELTMDIQGIKISAPVTSIRKVNWRNMRTNFYMIFSPGALEGAPITFVATVHIPEDKELELQHAVAQALPNITALSTRDIVDTVENVVGKLTTLVDFMSAFAIGAGLFILSGSVASTKFRRLKESAILKVLGARRKVVAEVLGIEYLALGAVSGVTGIGLSMALSWAVMKYLVKSPWQAHPTALVWTLVLTLILTTLTGTLSSLDVLRNKPLQTLRKLDG